MTISLPTWQEHALAQTSPVLILNASTFEKNDGKWIIRRGRNHAGHQQYYCRHCKKWFVETIDTPLYRRKLAKPDVVRICTLLSEKKRIKEIESFTGFNRDTIYNLMRDLILNIEATEDLLKEAHFSPQQMIDMWVNIKNRKKVD